VIALGEGDRHGQGQIGVAGAVDGDEDATEGGAQGHDVLLEPYPPRALAAPARRSPRAAGRTRLSGVTPATRRAPRKDAQRNRERILTAAREVVAEHGVAAKMEQVAERAGVGIGTLYRFVPTKEALFGGILRELSERLRGLLGDLVRRSQADRDLRDDVAASDVLMVLLATARVSEGTAATAEAYARRFLALQLDALRPGGTALTGVPLTERQLERTLDALTQRRHTGPGVA
jgi:AcrR family transcriptional regulator